jgi:type IV pilus assembly protein PilO
VKILLAALVFLLPVVLFYFLIYSPNQDKIASLEKRKTTLTAEVKKAKAAARNLKKYQQEVAEAKARFETTAIVLPKKKEIPELLRNISDLGKGAGLDFLSFKPGKEIAKDFYAEIPVDISIRGPYHNMGYFLDQVSKLDRIVTVDNIKMGSPKQEGGEMLLNSSCRLMTYRFTNTQATKPGDKKKKKGKRKK